MGETKNYKGGRDVLAPRPLCSFSATQNCSDWCLSLVFVGFNLLILCWLAGANDEVHSFKFNPYFLTFEALGIFEPFCRSFYRPFYLRFYQPLTFQPFYALPYSQICPTILPTGIPGRFRRYVGHFTSRCDQVVK